VSTVVFALLFAVLAGPLGPVAADVVALGACALANTAANRRLTFSLRGRSGRGRSYAAGTALAALPLVATLAVLGLLDALGITSVGAQLVALTATNALATLGRFLALRHWVFRDDTPTPVPAEAR
jgi:putative flippase GtrA